MVVRALAIVGVALLVGTDRLLPAPVRGLAPGRRSDIYASDELRETERAIANASLEAATRESARRSRARRRRT